MERKKLDRAMRPYRYPDKYLVVEIPAHVTGNVGRKTLSFTFKEWGSEAKAKAAAEDHVEKFNAKAALKAGMTVEEALESYPAYLAKPKSRRNHGNGPASIQGNLRNVRNILTKERMRLADISKSYLAKREDERRGTCADATLINEIKAVSRFLAWCTLEKWISENPLAGYQVLGDLNKGGKGLKQPDLDDLPKIRDMALVMAERDHDDDGAAAVAVALQTGLRVTKLLTRRARHVDLKGFAVKLPREGRLVVNKGAPPVMLIGEPRVGAILQRLKEQCPTPDGYLWPAQARGAYPSKSGHRCRNWLADQVRRVCREAGVSDDTHAHGMRGAFGTLATMDGQALEVIRKQMGHAPGSSVTTTAYVQPGAVQLSDQAKVYGDDEGED